MIGPHRKKATISLAEPAVSLAKPYGLF